MEQVARKTESNQVLAAGASGQRLEMIREADGWLTITLNGNPGPGCRWPADKLDQCVAVFMALLRSSAGALVTNPTLD